MAYFIIITNLLLMFFIGYIISSDKNKDNFSKEVLEIILFLITIILLLINLAILFIISCA